MNRCANPGLGLNQLTLWRDATRLLKLIEGAVRRLDTNLPWFARCAQPPVAQIRSRRICPRYHKYTLGSDLHRQAMTVCRLILRAWHARDDRARQLDRLVLAVDDLKLLIQLGKELGAFASFAEFQGIAEAAVTLGRQSGGWRRRAGQPPSPPPEATARA